MRTVQTISNTDNTGYEINNPPVPSAEITIEQMMFLWNGSAVISDSEGNQNPFTGSKGQSSVMQNELHTAFVVRVAGNAPPDIMQKCRGCKKPPNMPAEPVNRRKIIIQRQRQPAYLISMAEILGEDFCRAAYEFEITFLQITTRSFSFE